MEKLRQKVVDFLNDIVLKVGKVESFKETAFKPFLKEILILQGKIYFTENASISNLLHEAGHLAVLHPDYRKYVSGSVSKALKKCYAEIDTTKPENNKYCYMEEVVAGAWAWAVGKHLDIPENLIIENQDYKGEGGNERAFFQAKGHFGITQMQYAGFSVSQERLKKLPQFADLPVYPKLKKWLQD